jgi:low temperature requirement protein LtrA
MPEGKGVTWGELFFDLIFVFSITKLVPEFDVTPKIDY